MNLLEQQSAAKDLPMQYLQQAVNGQNPNLTPWIATAELQRRTTMNQHMRPQGPQGPQPTVKDQVEQKAGLMATQAAQQAQAAQAQQSATPPGPIPGGIPQPEPQPEEPVMAARGGLMEAPVSFKFAHGGILGYAEGSKDPVPDPEAAQLASDRKAVEDGLKKFGYAAADIAAMPFRAASALLNTLIVRPTRAVTGAAVPYFPMMGGGDDSSVTPFTDRAYKEKQAAAAPAVAAGGSGRGGPGGQGGASAAEMAAAQGIKAALPQPPAPPAQAVRSPAKPGIAQAAPAAQPAPAAQTAAMDPVEKSVQEFSTAPVKPASLPAAITEEQTLAGTYGLDKPMGGEQRQAMDERRKAYDEYKSRAADRDFANYAAGLVGVPGSGGARYEQSRGQRYKDEAEFQREQIKDLSALEAAQRAAQEKRSGIAGSSLAADKLRAADEGKSKAQVGATLSGNRMQSLASKYNVDEQVRSAKEIALIRERAENARQGSSDARQAANELRDRERAVEADITALTSRANKLTGSFSVEDRKELADVNEALKNARAQKALIRGGTGAAPAGTMTPPPPGAVRLKKG